MMQENPAWVNRILNEHWDAIEDRIGPELMPTTTRVGRKRRAHEPELGCGHYGCVLATVGGGLVFKLSSDPSEAAFVAAALSLPASHWPPGMIRYHDLFEIPGETHRRRKVYGIVRQEATQVGLQLLPAPSWKEIRQSVPERWVQKYREDSIAEGVRWLMLFKECASRVKEYIGRQKGAGVLETLEKIRSHESLAIRWRAHEEPPEDRIAQDRWFKKFDYKRPKPFRGAEQAAVDLQRCAEAAEMMSSSIHFVSSIGAALDYYLDQGMLLADVHLGNIGEAEVEWDTGDLGLDMVITDPGHMVPLTPKWLTVNVPKL